MNIYFYFRFFPAAAEYRRIIDNGVKKAIHGLASGLAYNGAKVTVLCEGEKDSSFRTNYGYDIRCFSNRFIKFSKFLIAKSLKKYIKESIQPGIIILSGIFHPSVYSLSQILKKLIGIFLKKKY